MTPTTDDTNVRHPAQPQQTETPPMPDTPRRTRNAEVDFRGEKRSNGCHWNAIGPRDNGIHASVTDSDARPYKKAPGAAAMLCFMRHPLMESRDGLVVQAELTQADEHGERKAALDMIERQSPGSSRRLTPGADKGYDSADFIAALRRMVVTPHIAQKARHSAIDGRTTQHPGYALSRRRKKIEEPFGRAKTVGGMAQTVHRGLDWVRAQFTITIGSLQSGQIPEAPGRLTAGATRARHTHASDQPSSPTSSAAC